MNTTSGTGFKMKHAVAWYQSRCLLASYSDCFSTVCFEALDSFEIFRDSGSRKNCCSWFWNLNFSSKESNCCYLVCTTNILIVNVISLAGDSCFLFFHTVFLRKVRNADLFFNSSKLFELWIIFSIRWNLLVKWYHVTNDFEQVDGRYKFIKYPD